MGVKSVTVLVGEEKNGVHSVITSLNGPLDGCSLADEEVPVLIVGGGPSGLLQAHMLSCLGGM